MDYRRMGRTGTMVSPLCLGTMNFNWKTDQAESHAIMSKALEVGINFFDTSCSYGHKGGSERIIGEWFAADATRRDQVVLATKVFSDMIPEDAAWKDPNRARGLSARKIMLQCEESLRRMQTDRIDLYQMHHIDRDCPIDEVLQAFQTLMRQGKVIYVGCSNFAGWDIARYNEFATASGLPHLVTEQSVYSLENRHIELEVVPACRHYGMGILPWSPLSGGFLAGVLGNEGGDRRKGEGVQRRVTERRPQLEAWEGLCKELGHPPAHVALAWLLHNPVVTAPILGPRTVDQVTDALAVLDLALDEATMANLDEIFPGPGGEAPKAYAW